MFAKKPNMIKADHWEYGHLNHLCVGKSIKS